ncbi:sodium channel protein Nach-like [Hylaeus volcanicus]|uniref:sodium channel protein Nach-like n=1 Tax=Hylaeus volcanicus TaxID=313075 RepID=UPI0023B867F6|nr:sodium channel protein Nach-like [Hylaeus volcanicus]
MDRDRPNRKQAKFRRTLLNILKTCYNVLRKQSLEFCNQTGLHGYKYIAEPHRSTAARIAWAIAVFTSLCIALGIIKITFDFYENHQVSAVIESTHHGIWNYPFPAVTVCNINRISLRMSRELAEKLIIPPTMSKEFIVQELSLLNELLYPGKSAGNIRTNLSRLQNIFDRNDLSIPMVIRAVTQPCKEFLSWCKLKFKERNCSQIFKTSFTREGICCSYNYVTTPEEESVYRREPVRSASCGYQSGLQVMLNVDPDDYHGSMIGSIGIKVMLHDPHDYPDFDALTKLINIGKYSFLTVQPEKMYSTSNLHSVRPSKRTCIFSHEWSTIKNAIRREDSFPTAKYSFRNCMTECRAFVIKKKCGCIPYYYPQNNTRVCNLRDVECLEAFKYWYETSWPGMDMSPKNLPFVKVDIQQKPCACRSDCDFYRFSMENSMGNLNKHTFYNKNINNTSKVDIWKNRTMIHVFFGDLVSIQYRRDVLYNWRHMFATFGGILGLFAGFSLMSVLEFIYFFVIRVIIDVCRNRKNTKDTIQTDYQ